MSLGTTCLLGQTVSPSFLIFRRFYHGLLVLVHRFQLQNRRLFFLISSKEFLPDHFPVGTFQPFHVISRTFGRSWRNFDLCFLNNCTKQSICSMIGRFRLGLFPSRRHRNGPRALEFGRSRAPSRSMTLLHRKPFVMRISPHRRFSKTILRIDAFVLSVNVFRGIREGNALNA